MSQLLKVLTIAAALATGATAVGGEAETRCGGCHALTEPDIASKGIAERLERKAPPLWYAGNKYREGWLAAWLKAPETIFPVGYFPNAAVRQTPEGDVPDPDKLHRHEPLDDALADAIAAELMALEPHDDLIAAVSYTPGSLALRMGTMDFRKFKGCQSCHQDAPGEGGLSGPELHTAWQRLEPAYMVSFIADPKAWDANTIMPRMEMNDAAVNKLVDYLRLIGEKE